MKAPDLKLEIKGIIKSRSNLFKNISELSLVHDSLLRFNTLLALTSC